MPLRPTADTCVLVLATIVPVDPDGARHRELRGPRACLEFLAAPALVQGYKYKIWRAQKTARASPGDVTKLEVLVVGFNERRSWPM